MRKPRVREGTLDVSGGTLNYAVMGCGVPVLVIGSAVYYRRTFSPRLADSCSLAFGDLRHFAPSVAEFDPERVTIDSYAEDVESLRAAVGFNRCLVVGHSKHGNIAVEYARRFPERVSGVALVGSPPCGGAGVLAARSDYWESQASEHRKAVYERNCERLAGEVLARLSPGQAVVAQYVADGPKYWFDPEFDASPLWKDVFVNAPMLERLHELFLRYEMRWDAGEIGTPVLVVMGRYDFAVPNTLWDEIRSKQPGIRYMLFERSGHTPQLEETERFDREFVSWLCDIGEFGREVNDAR